MTGLAVGLMAYVNMRTCEGRRVRCDMLVKTVSAKTSTCEYLVGYSLGGASGVKGTAGLDRYMGKTNNRISTTSCRENGTRSHTYVKHD